MYFEDVTGLLEQAVAYYPYGAVIADLSTNLSTQPYKFGGKELITANGLNEYDFGASVKNSARICRFPLPSE